MKYYERKINYYETDQMAIVHHSNYIRFFEEARVSFMDQVGYTYARLESEDILSPVINVSCRFLRPLRFGDAVRIEVRLRSISKLKCSFEYEVKNALNGELCAKGSSEHGFVDKNGKPVILPKQKPEFYETFMNELEKEDN